jgi:hypothetical protein
MNRLLVPCLFALSACVFGGGDADDDDVLGGSRTVTGEVVDFQTGEPVASAASLGVSGVVPAPTITTQGATFRIEGVPDNSTFQILASAPPTHRSTFSPSVEVLLDDVSGVKAPVASEAFLQSLAQGFGVAPTAANGVLIGRLVDASGNPRAGVPAGELVIAGNVDGPYFLDANLMPAPQATTSSASGYFVFFEVSPGVVELAQAANAMFSLVMPASPVNPAGVTLVNVRVGDGPPELPTNVSFANDIIPIFAVGGTGRGCVACHSGGGPGKDQGGLNLGGGIELSYRELVEENNRRVRVGAPETSTLLTMPSREDPPDAHPNVTFASNTDPDYIKILVWIREGAKKN